LFPITSHLVPTGNILKTSIAVRGIIRYPAGMTLLLDYEVIDITAITATLLQLLFAGLMLHTETYMATQEEVI
jgi:hypothetical protein